jgi:predicted GNAT family acetyltransferase
MACVWQNRCLQPQAATMSVVRHTDPMIFLAAAGPVLARDDAMASSFVAWANNLVRNPPPAHEPVYLATFDHAGALGAAVLRGQGGLWLGVSDEEAAVAFAADVHSAGDEASTSLQGIVGAGPACEAFARAWHTLTGRRHALRFHLRHHELTQVETVPRSPGTARVATAADIDWLIAAQLDFLGEARMTDSPDRARAMTPGRVERGQFWIWDDGGNVAMAGWTDAPPDNARIAPVYTSQEARGRGYATALVASLSRALLAMGRRRLFLITDLANPVSNSIYAKIGYRPRAELFHFEFVDAAAHAGAAA